MNIVLFHGHLFRRFSSSSVFTTSSFPSVNKKRVTGFIILASPTNLEEDKPKSEGFRFVDFLHLKASVHFLSAELG